MTHAKQQIKERPILFSGPMVRAILEGHKTQTRRIIKGAALSIVDCGAPVDIDLCPYGHPSDRLWVRETWAHDYNGDGYMHNADWGDTPMLGTWRPSIHMPRAASRILLEITDIRAERLHEITASDCVCEGIEFKSDVFTTRNAFVSLWQSIHGEESWQENPWVWVIEFKRIEP